jgi:hypothetical protein
VSEFNKLRTSLAIHAQLTELVINKLGNQKNMLMPLLFSAQLEPTSVGYNQTGPYLVLLVLLMLNVCMDMLVATLISIQIRTMSLASQHATPAPLLDRMELTLAIQCKVFNAAVDIS